jgi:hypothetical protein
MGDRVNFGFKQPNGDILYLYQHWGGYQHSRRLAEALDIAEPRVNDPGYATRIVISQLIGDDWESLTGHGLYVNELPDNEYNVHVVDFYNNKVTLHHEDRNAEKGIDEEPIWTMFIDDFIQSELAKVLTDTRS